VLKSKSIVIPRIEAFKYEVEIQTSDLIAAHYNHILIGVTQNAEVIIKESRIEFSINPKTSLKVKSYYEIILENIEGFLKENDSIRHSEYEIDGRQIKRHSLLELTRLRDKFSKLLAAERAGINTANPPRSVRYLF
jgi:hypothetical protein